MASSNTVAHPLNAHRDIMSLLADKVMASLSDRAWSEDLPAVPATGRIFFTLHKKRCDCAECETLRSVFRSL